jgi:glutaryl-CoA dehydrogenase
MITEITKAQLLTWRLGVLRNEGRATTAQISMAKRNNVDMAINIAREARQILGGMGITEYSIMRHMMNLESVITYEGTHDIHLLTQEWISLESQRLSSNKQLLKYI